MKRDSNIKTSLSLRAVAGAYLLYQIFGMIDEYGKMAPKEQPKYLIFIVLFVIADAVILGTTARTWYLLKKEEKQQSAEQVENTEDAEAIENAETIETAEAIENVEVVEKTEDSKDNK